MEEEVTHLMVTGRQRERHKWVRTPVKCPFKDVLPVTSCPPTRPYFLKVPALSNHTRV